jgi:hypothetical protein
VHLCNLSDRVRWRIPRQGPILILLLVLFHSERAASIDVGDAPQLQHQAATSFVSQPYLATGRSRGQWMELCNAGGTSTRSSALLLAHCPPPFVRFSSRRPRPVQAGHTALLNVATGTGGDWRGHADGSIAREAPRFATGALFDVASRQRRPGWLAAPSTPGVFGGPRTLPMLLPAEGGRLRRPPAGWALRM